MILAVMTIYQCEDCPRVAICQHDIEYETYEATWFDGLRYHFCPNCRVKPQAEDRIAEDQQRRRSIRMAKIEYVN